MEAERIYLNEEGHLFLPPRLCYGKDKDGVWWFRHPSTHGGMLLDHKVLEHEDGTITVAPSIVMGSVHGFLVAGHWRDC